MSIYIRGRCPAREHGTMQCTVEDNDEVLQKHVCSLLLASVSQDGDFVQFVEKLLAGRFVYSKVNCVHLITFS